MDPTAPGIPPALRERAAAVRCLVLDVDGVLTDGRLWHGPDGSEWKTTSVRDGLGIRMLLDAGLQVAVISGRPSPPIRQRLADLGVRELHFGVDDKLPPFADLCRRMALEPRECAMMGDDTPDLPLMRRCGLGLTVADAHPQVLAAADWVSRMAGGRGAVREACDLLLAARGLLT